MIKKVVDLRSKLQNHEPVCASTPGWYRWWCDKEAANVILEQIGLNLADSFLFCKDKEFNGRECLAIYFGISRDLNARINWHICQNHTAGSIRSGFLSTLRQSLSALLNCDMSKSQQLVNDFIDANCFLEYENSSTHEEAENIEKVELSKNAYYYHLNISGAKSTTKYIKNKLTTLRKSYRR